MSHPILLLDVMSTIVYDPFAVELPRHFGTTLESLLAEKDLEAWPEFERDEISEDEFFTRFFADRRAIDGPAMREAMREGYRFLDGMEDLLARLHNAGIEMHTLSNYPCWWEMIEEKLALSRFVKWTFVSCKMGHRKPAPEAYLVPVRELGVEPERCIFVDDRGSNCKAAVGVGMQAIKFEHADALEHALHEHGLAF